jgi:copper chaperone CopZ
MAEQQRRGLWSSIKMITETQSGRQALTTTGAVIAAAYLGHIGPELFMTMNDALAVFAGKYPFMNPLAMSTALWEGAQYFSASLVDYAYSAFETVGIDMSKTVREAVNACREFISRGGQRSLDAARETLMETASYIGGNAAEITAAIKNAVGAGIEAVKSNFGPILAGLAVAREAYEYYETGESIYHRLFKRGRKAVKDASPADNPATEEEVNVTVNTAFAGTEVLVSADAQLRRKSVAEILSIDPDQVIWVSEKL